jgi:hypothetical protein
VFKLSFWSSNGSAPVRDGARSNLRFRPQVEGFEDRTVPAAPATLGPALAAPAAVSPASLLPISVSSVTLDPVTGALNVVGTIGNQAFQTTGLLTLTQPTTGSTPILDLHLNAIHLNVLGLTVDTSDICLNITAQSGPGQLLGNLLTDVANLLNSPTGGLLGTVEGELGTLLNNVLGGLGSQSNVTGTTGGHGGHSTTGNILHLSLGPVDLNVLGLDVHLDNCNNGPVTVDIGAQSGPGQLLGNLLNSVTHLLDGSANTNALTNALNRVAGQINNLLA